MPFLSKKFTAAKSKIVAKVGAGASVLVGSQSLSLTGSRYFIEVHYNNDMSTNSSDELSNVKKAYRESRQEINKVERLSAEYDACIEALDAKYPGEEVDPEQYDAYTAEYNRCQAIYDKLQAY